MMLQYILDNTARPLFTGPPGYDPPQQVRDIWNCSEVTRCSTATSSGYPFPLATKGSVAATLLDSPDVSTEDSDEAPAWQEDVDTVTIKFSPRMYFLCTRSLGAEPMWRTCCNFSERL
ncbi:unnamed protein product [Polarella glacialis]|uniref:Uncharacterized protein n=1 Tax=Polarella glacialis TaxID=89957 RepID=A0A813GME3_POLGL|nr:unnamed protein product [Polarella glacialis]